MPSPLRVHSVLGHCVPFRDGDDQLHVGVFVGYDREGRQQPEAVDIPDTPYYWAHLETGALLRASAFLTPDASRPAKAKPSTP